MNLRTTQHYRALPFFFVAAAVALVCAPAAAQSGMGVNPDADTRMGVEQPDGTGTYMGVESRDSMSKDSMDNGTSRDTSTSTGLNVPTPKPTDTDRIARMNAATTGQPIRTHRGSGHHFYEASRYWMPDPGIEQGLGPASVRNDAHWKVAGHRSEMDMSRSLSPGTGMTTSATVATTADRDFIQKAYADSAREVRLGHLASQRAGSEEVKRYAARMIADHGRAMRQLERIASHSDTELVSGFDHKELLLTERLKELSGREFDRVYMQHVIDHHEAGVSDFQRNSTGDSVSASWAEHTLPTLEYHQRVAVAIGTEAP